MKLKLHFFLFSVTFSWFVNSQVLVMKNYGNLTVHNNGHMYVGGSVENTQNANLVINGVFEIIGDMSNTGNILSNNNNSSSYGSFKFTGGNNQTLGTNSSVTLSIDEINLNKTTGEVKLTSNIVVSKISLNGGDINASGKTITIGSSVGSPGTIEIINQTSGIHSGKVKRWFGNATNSSIESGVFPLKLGNGETRKAIVNYTSAPSVGGTLEASWVNTPMGTDGLLATITAGGNGCSGNYVMNGSADGYWQIDDANGLNGGVYSLYLEGDNVPVFYDGSAGYNFEDACQVTAVKRQGNNPWGISGIHVSNTGTASSPKISISGAQGWSNWGFAGQTTSPLPVELISFSGECLEDAINLNWTTLSEHNSSHFDIEKSEDGEDWIKIATVEAAGNSNSTINYSIQDNRKSIQPNLYYRLNQVDVDGQNEVFGPISISCESNLDINSDISLFPNPNNGDFQVIMKSNQDDKEITMVLTDTYGRKVFSMNNILQGGINLYSFNNHNLDSGVYYFYVLLNGVSINSTRLIVNGIK